MSVIVDVIINTDQAEQQLQALQQQIANDLAQGAARIGTTAGQAATATARAAGKNATEEFLRAFDPDKLRSELQSAGLGEQEIEIILDTTAAKAETQKLKDSIAGALSGATGLAEDQLKQITAQVAREVDRAAGKVKSVTEIVDGVRDLKTEIQGLGQAGDAASEGLGQLVLNESVDKFGDLKDIFEKTGTALFGLSQEAVDAAVRVGDLAEKGAMVGAAFGPMGAAIGLVAGGVLGFFVERINETNRIAEEAAERLEVYRGRVEALKVAANIAISQKELANAIEQGRLAAETNTGAVKILSDAQIKLNADIKAGEEQFAAYQAELDAARAAYQGATTAQEQYEARQRLVQASNAANIVTSRELSTAKEQLTQVTKALTIAEAEQEKVALRLARAQALQAVDTLDAANAIRGQLLEITEGSKFAGQKTEALQKEYDKLKQSLDANANAVESLALANIVLGDAQGSAAAAAEAQAENETAAQGVLAGSEVQLARLAELEAELKTRKAATTAATVSSTKATKEDTKAKEASLKPLAKQLTDFDKLIALEKEHEAFLTRQKQTAAEGLFGQDYLTQGIDDAAAAMGKQTEDLLQMIELDGRTVSEKVQDDIDALRKFKEEAAAELAKQAKVKYLKDVADAEAMAMEANVAAYMQILQPYSAFIGGIFNQFAEAIASGQSATEAFAESAKSAIAGILGALAKEFGARSLAAFAAGFSAAAIGNPVSAVAFYKSGAAYAAAAAAAGLGAAVVSSAGAGSAPSAGAGSAPSVGGGTDISASSGGVGATSNSLGGSSQQSNSTPGSIVVDLRGAVFPTNDLTGAQQFGEAVARSLAAASAGNQPMARRLIGTRGFVV